MDVQAQAVGSDADIVRQVLAGDVDAFEHLLVKYKGYVLSIVGRHVPLMDVEEVAQDAFVRAYRSLHGIKKEERFKYWLSAITHRTCYDFWRKRYKTPEVAVSQLSEAQAAILEKGISSASANAWESKKEKAEASALLDRLMSGLTPAERMILEMLYLEERPVKETAGLLGWTETNVKVRAFRARQKLKKAVQQMRSVHETDR